MLLRSLHILLFLALAYFNQAQIVLPAMRGAVSSPSIPTTMYSGGSGGGGQVKTNIQNVCTPLVIQDIFYGGAGYGDQQQAVIQNPCTPPAIEDIYYGGGGYGDQQQAVIQNACTPPAIEDIFYGGSGYGDQQQAVIQNPCTPPVVQDIFYGGAGYGDQQKQNIQNDCYVITSNLVLSLDAGNPSSYSGTGNVWSDLSGNGNAMMLPVPIVNSYTNLNRGSFYFDQDVSYTISNTSLTNADFSTSNAVSFEVWIKYKSTGDYQFFISSYESCNYRFGIASDGTFYWDMGHHVDRNPRGYALTENEWKQVVMTGGLEGGVIKTRIYVNGVEVHSQDEGRSTLPDLTSIYIGSGEYDNYYLFRGNMSILRVYNKALTAEEVMQNYNAVKNRF